MPCPQYIILFPEKMRANPKPQPTHLDISIQVDNPSQLSQSLGSKQLKQSYSEYISRFGQEIDYSRCSAAELEASLAEMRVVLRELNVMLNRMMDKNYQYLAQRDTQVNTPEKEIELLKAQIQNTKKLITNQDSQILQLNNTTYQMQDKHSYEQELIDQIAEIKQKMPNIHLESKHNACDINRNGYLLVNQEQDTSLYFRVNVLRADLERGNQRLKRAEEKFNAILEKERELEEKNYQMMQKFDKCVEFAKMHSMEVTVHGAIISFHQKYDNLCKRKEQQLKKNNLLEHVARNNEANIQKKISDMKKLMFEYNLKQQQLQKRLLELEKQSAELLSKSNLVTKLAQKSFTFRYAEVLLKGDKQENAKVKGKKNDQNDDYDNYEDDFEDIEPNKSSVKKGEKAKKVEPNIFNTKPSLNVIRKKNELGQNRYQKSNSMVEIPVKSKNEVKPPIFQFEDDEKALKASKNPMFHVRRSSANENLKKNDKKEVNISLDRMPESPNVKHWKNQKGETKDNEQKQYKMSKPLMNLKKRAQNMSMMERNQVKGSKKNIKEDAEQIAIQPKFSRLTNKKTGNKMTDQYMDYLQQKGRKILGLS